MLDIEDGVAPNEKDTARKNIADVSRDASKRREPRRATCASTPSAITRMDADLEAVVRPGLEGLVCPKVDTVDEVRKSTRFSTTLEPNNKLAKGM